MPVFAVTRMNVYIPSPGPNKFNANNVLYLTTIYYYIHKLAHWSL